MKFIGEVKMYDRARSFGFIQEFREHGSEHFFHISRVINRTILKLGDCVIFEIAPNPKRPGQTMAVNIRLSKRDELVDTADVADVANAPQAEVRQ